MISKGKLILILFVFIAKRMSSITQMLSWKPNDESILILSLLNKNTEKNILSNNIGKYSKDDKKLNLNSEWSLKSKEQEIALE